MMRFSDTWVVLVLLAVITPSVSAHTEFKKALQEKYDYKTVSCFTCHQKKSEVADEEQAAFKENAKAFRNAFGDALHEGLEEKDVTKRLADVKKLATDDPDKKKVKEAVTQEFVQALKKVEELESPSGPTYGELLKTAKLSGVKPK